MQKQTEFGYAELQVKSEAKYQRKRSRNKAARSAAKPRTAAKELKNAEPKRYGRQRTCIFQNASTFARCSKVFASFTPNHLPIAAAQRTVFCNETTVLNPYYKKDRTFKRNAPPYNFSSFEVKNRNAAALRNAVCLSERSERV